MIIKTETRDLLGGGRPLGDNRRGSARSNPALLPIGRSVPGLGLGLPYFLAAIALAVGAAIAVGLATWSPLAPDQRLVLSTIALTASVATAVPSSALLVSHGRIRGQQADLAAGLVVMLVGLGLIVPFRLLPTILSRPSDAGAAVGLGAVAAIMMLARLHADDRIGPRNPDLVKGPAFSFGFVSTIALLASIAGVVDVAAVGRVVGHLGVLVGASIFLVRGYRREQWSLVVIGVQLLTFAFGDYLVADEIEVTGGAWLGANVLALIGAIVGTAGALAIDRAGSIDAQAHAVEAALDRVRMLHDHAHDAETLHDLRSGLLGVEAFAGSLLTAHQPVEGVDLVVSELARLRELVAEVPGFADSPLTEVSDLSAGLHQLVAARIAMGDTIATDVEPRVGVLGERYKVLDVVQNLIDNAVRHGERTPIAVVARLEGPSVRITVTDEGPGFVEEQLPRVFERGFTTSPIGSGLGLHIVRQRVEELGGTVAVMNRTTGGARVDVTLPARRLAGHGD